MKNYLTFLGYAALFVVSVALLGFIANLAGLANFSFFAPKVEQVRYNAFKESQAYNDGMIRDLQELKRQYVTSNPDQQSALRAIVLQRFSVYPTDKLPLDLQSFYMSISQGFQK